MNVPKLLVDTLNWNLNNIKGLFYGLSTKTLTNPTADFSYSVYLLSFAIFLLVSRSFLGFLKYSRFSTFGDRGAIYFGGDWKSYSYVSIGT